MSNAITALKSDVLTLIHGMFIVSNKKGNRTFTITPDCLCPNETVQFLATYGRLGEEGAIKYTQKLCDRFQANQPFSGYLIREGKKVVGHSAMEYSEKPGCLYFGLIIADPRCGIATGVWKWTVERLLPALHRKGFQIPVFANEKIVKYVSIPEGSFCAMARKDVPLLSQLLIRARFRLIQENMETYYGKRDLYEVRMADFLPSSTDKAATMAALQLLNLQQKKESLCPAKSLPSSPMLYP